MKQVKHSVILSSLGTGFLALLMLFEKSLFYANYKAFASAIVGGVENSHIIGYCRKTSRLSRAWAHSLTCKGLIALLNLPLLLLRLLDEKFEEWTKGSHALRFIAAMTAETPIAVGWLMCLILLIPYEQWNNAYSLLGFALMLCMAIVAGVRNERIILQVRSVGQYPVFFAGFVFVAVMLSLSPASSARFLLYHLSGMLCVLVLVSTVQKVAQLRRLASMSSLGLIVMSAYAFVQRIQGIEVNPSFVDLTLNEGMPGRVFSFFENPNAFGEVLVLLIPISVGLLFGAKHWLERLLALGGAVLGTGAILMTYSRASWLGLVMAAVLFIFLWNRKFLPPLLLLGVLAIPCLPDTIFNRIMTIFNFSDSSTSSRFPLYEAAGRLIAERPLQGAGLGTEAVRNAVKAGNLYHGTSPFVHAHSVYLQVWCEMGILGLWFFLASAISTLKRGGSLVMRKLGGSSVRMLLIGSLSSLVGILVCGIADFIWHYPRVMLVFWFVFALALCGIRLCRLQQQD